MKGMIDYSGFKRMPQKCFSEAVEIFTDRPAVEMEGPESHPAVLTLCQWWNACDDVPDDLKNAESFRLYSRRDMGGILIDDVEFIESGEMLCSAEQLPIASCAISDDFIVEFIQAGSSSADTGGTAYESLVSLALITDQSWLYPNRPELFTYWDVDALYFCPPEYAAKQLLAAGLPAKLEGGRISLGDCEYVDMVWDSGYRLCIESESEADGWGVDVVETKTLDQLIRFALGRVPAARAA